MPAGQNSGNQLNLLLFEVVTIRRNPETEEETVRTVSVHPMVVAPAVWNYTDSSRSSAVQTAIGGAMNRGGRAWLQAAFQGSWGVRSDGLFPYIGTGETRHLRFWHEVVRMSDALQKDDVNAAIKRLSGTPFLKLILAPYFADPDNTMFAINFYDVWNDVKFQCYVPRYAFTRQARGGATGLITYQLNVQECGPVVTGGVGTALINALFDGLSAWNDLNRALESYTVDSLVNSAFGVAAILQTQVSRTLDAVLGQIEAVTGLTAGFSATSNDNLSAFLADAAELDGFADDVIEAIDGSRSSTAEDNAVGQVGWFLDPDFPELSWALAGSDALDDAEDLQDAARWQPCAGKLFGMSRSEFAGFLGATDGEGRVLGSQSYTVTGQDTADDIEEVFGVSFDAILAHNRLLPDEALIEGTVLEIPYGVVIQGGQTRIEGLPTFGSHLGEAAWGSDLYPDLAKDSADGDLLHVSGPDVLQQGIDWLIKEASDEILAFVNKVPDVQNADLNSRLKAIGARIESLVYARDPRIENVDDVQVEQVETTGIAVSVVATAINGGTVGPT